MDPQFSVESNAFIKEKQKRMQKKKQKQNHGDIYHFEEFTIGSNLEEWKEEYQKFLKNMNIMFINSHHNMFSACNQNNLERERVLAIENHKIYHRLKQKYDKKMEKVMNSRNQREYKNYQRHQLEKENEKKKKKMEVIIKDIINAALKIVRLGSNCGDYFFYENLFFLEKMFFLKKIKNINELVQNNAHNKEANYALSVINQKEKIIKDYTRECRKSSNKFCVYFDFLKRQKIDKFFLLNLRNVPGKEKNYSTEKYAYIYLLEYLTKQGEWSYINRKEYDNDKLGIQYGNGYLSYRSKILEQVDPVDISDIMERMGDKYLHVSQDEDTEKSHILFKNMNF
ncbi:conserved Plasmodium protein, unknown function, partial [Plasmodium malariae]